MKEFTIFNIQIQEFGLQMYKVELQRLLTFY